MSYVPERGDAVWLQFNPQAGHRPALVLSPKSYNAKVGLMLACPITNQKKGYPFEVKLPEDLEVSGVILSDQVKNLDWKARNVSFIVKLPQEIVDDVLEKLKTLLG